MSTVRFRIMNKILWFGMSTSYVLWFDIGNFFSIDVGKWFIRLFFKVNAWSFCRYLGSIHLRNMIVPRGMHK